MDPMGLWRLLEIPWNLGTLVVSWTHPRVWPVSRTNPAAGYENPPSTVPYLTMELRGFTVSTSILCLRAAIFLFQSIKVDMWTDFSWKKKRRFDLQDNILFLIYYMEFYVQNPRAIFQHFFILQLNLEGRFPLSQWSARKSTWNKGFLLAMAQSQMATCFCLDLDTLVSRMSWIDEPGSPNVSFHEAIKPITSQRVFDRKKLC